MGNPLSAPQDSGAQWTRHLAGFRNQVLNLLLPPRCLLCKSLIDTPRELCAACWRRLDFIADPCCAACGWPFDYDLGGETLCAACIARPPRFTQGRAALRYQEASRDLILAFKHGDRLDGASRFAGWMKAAGAAVLTGADVLVPVPLHRWRLWRRRYNQAALLAHALADQTGIPCRADALIRTRRTVSQGGLSRQARWRNVRGAFAVHPRRRRWIEGARIVLIDDVMTTGATFEAAARCLERAGAAEVRVLCLARVVSPAQMPI